MIFTSFHKLRVHTSKKYRSFNFFVLLYINNFSQKKRDFECVYSQKSLTSHTIKYIKVMGKFKNYYLAASTICFANNSNFSISSSSAAKSTFTDSAPFFALAFSKAATKSSTD